MRSLVVVAAVLSLGATPLPPRSQQFVYDAAQVIDDSAERSVERAHRELFARTGVAIVVVTVPRLVDESIDQLAVRVGQTWGVGRRGEDRGLVVAFAREDRKVFVATGYGTEGYLPDGRVGAMLDEHALPWFRQDRFSEGLVQLSQALVAASAAEYGVTLTGQGAAQPGAAEQPGAGRLLLMILAMIGFVLLARRHPLLAMMLLMGGRRPHLGGGFGGGFGGGGFGGGGFGGGGAGRGF